MYCFVFVAGRCEAGRWPGWLTIRAKALAAFPDEFGKEQESLGKRREKELGGRLDDLDDVRARTDAQGDRVTAQDNQNRNDQAERAGTSIGKEVAEAIKVIEAGIRLELDKIKSDASLKASRINQG